MILDRFKNLLIVNGTTIKRGLLIAIGCLTLTIIVAVISLSSLVVTKYHSFLQGAELEHQQVMAILKSFRSSQPLQKPMTILILGLDTAANRQNQPQLTDTIMLTQVDPNSGQIKLISLPRDLWSPTYQTKINALYEYGHERYPLQPERFPQEVISDLTATNIDRTLIIRQEQLGELVNLAGGIMINVEQGFVDEEFPRSDVDITTETNPDKLYETVKFKPGWQLMTGDRALKYIRSRHSQNLETGTDLARSYRQQQVIQALVGRLTTLCLYWQQPHIAGQLLHYYQTQFEQYLPLADLLSLTKALGSQASKINMESLAIPTDNNFGQPQINDRDPILTNPKDLQPYQDQWVYIIINQEEFQQFFQQHLVNGSP